jgi:twitching motility protein PilT
MPALDRLLDMSSQLGASALLLRPGEAPQYETSTGLQPAAKRVLDQTLVLGLVREIATAHARDLLNQGEAVQFAYRGFTVETNHGDGLIQARIAPSVNEAPPPPALTFPIPRARTAWAPSGGPLIEALVHEMVEREASDLHLHVGRPPLIRLHGDIVPLDQPPITPDQMAELLWPICPAPNREEWERDHDTDFAYEVKGLARFRCNYLMDRTGPGAVLRQIPTRIPTSEQLGVPKQVLELCFLSKGFVAVTGPTGSGKSTTLAALVDHINENRSDHIITIEDPIEFVHTNKKCQITQREVGTHTQGFKRALRAALREDPDIVLVGEMRDLETIAIAIETAETGHLVFGTLHTSTAPSTVDRIIDQFPADRQAQIRVMLSESLKGVVSQTLCKRVGGGRVAAYEILMVNNAVSNLIREGKTFQIPSVMQTQKAQGNLQLNDSLLDLVKQGVVEPREAYIKAVDKTGLTGLFERHKIKLDLQG